MAGSQPLKRDAEPVIAAEALLAHHITDQAILRYLAARWALGPSDAISALSAARPGRRSGGASCPATRPAPGVAVHRHATCRHCDGEILRTRPGLFRRRAWLHEASLSRFCPPETPDQPTRQTMAQPQFRSVE
jgi:hypothetical protein